MQTAPRPIPIVCNCVPVAITPEEKLRVGHYWRSRVVNHRNSVLMCILSFKVITRSAGITNMGSCSIQVCLEPALLHFSITLPLSSDMLFYVCPVEYCRNVEP